MHFVPFKLSILYAYFVSKYLKHIILLHTQHDIHNTFAQWANYFYSQNKTMILLVYV